MRRPVPPATTIVHTAPFGGAPTPLQREHGGNGGSGGGDAPPLRRQTSNVSSAGSLSDDDEDLVQYLPIPAGDLVINGLTANQREHLESSVIEGDRPVNRTFLVAQCTFPHSHEISFLKTYTVTYVPRGVVASRNTR
jgi:hypothetical protein